MLSMATPGAAALAAPIEVTDDAGHSLRLERPARRIIALYGAFNELLLALGCKEQIAARTEADAHLPGLADLPAVGTHMRPNAELIAARQPDLVLQMRGRGEAALQTEALRGLGLPVLSFDLNSFAQLFRVTELLGRLCGREAEAQALVASWRARLDALARSTAGRPRPRVFYEARYPNLLAAGAGGMVNEVIAAAGGDNVIRAPKKLVRLNEEALLAADPDAYLMQKGPMNPAPAPLAERPHFRGLRAAAPGRSLVVPEDRYARPGPRAIDAAEELAAWLAALDSGDAASAGGTAGKGERNQ